MKMKDTLQRSRSLGKAAARIAAGACLAAGLTATAGAQVLPPNPDPTCVVPATQFNGWFESGAPGLDKPVKPADSIKLDTSNNCNFYKWSEQMLLWLTSPASGPRGGRVFDSQIFYQVNKKTLVAQTTLGPRNFALRAAQAGPDGLPVIIDAAGHLREFVTAPSASGITALGVTGEAPAQIAKVEAGSNGKAVFRDAKGKMVKVTPKLTADMLPQTLGRLAGLATPPKGRGALSAAAERQQIADALTAAKVLIKIDTDDGPVFVEAGTGIIDNLGPGQAGGDGVLISQQNSVIFYETLVNDVFAWYLTGRKTKNGIKPLYNGGDLATYGLFPTERADLQSILDFSTTHGGPSSFPDGQALAIEAKLSWVDATTLPNNAQGYITTQANVTIYDTSNPRDWKPDGSKLVNVALVGVHIVGSATGHPEMIWSTFEHVANTPLDQYAYKKPGGEVVTVARNTKGAWLFSANGAPEPYNSLRATIPSQHIVAATPAAIGPSNILRLKSWGVASDGVPNQEDKTPADSNTEIISIDTNVQSQLAAAGASADPRYNYLLIGSTWTFGGGEPSGPYPKNPSNPTNPPAFNEIGTSMLFNSTMETFQQGKDSTYQASSNNCFACHSVVKGKDSKGIKIPPDPKTKANTSVSHIFGSVNPLPTP
jgi:hypothetical protein